ncbi:hypothetical protein C8R46DRAFT_1032685 [Mycena filopes]|nr:hypothetical protein C8R46DRAFT_1032685 [Mycena filopes]
MGAPNIWRSRILSQHSVLDWYPALVAIARHEIKYLRQPTTTSPSPSSQGTAFRGETSSYDTARLGACRRMAAANGVTKIARLSLTFLLQDEALVFPTFSSTHASDYNREDSSNNCGSNDVESDNFSGGNESRNNEDFYGEATSASPAITTAETIPTALENSCGGGAHYLNDGEGDRSNSDLYGGSGGPSGSNNREELRGSDNNTGGGSFGRDNEPFGNLDQESGGGMSSSIEKDVEMAEENSGHDSDQKTRLAPVGQV